jgi:hypothetical protein
MKPLSGAMETQEWLPFALLLSYEIFHTVINNINVPESSNQVPDIVV